MNTSLKKALGQIFERNASISPTDKAYIRLDYTSSAPASLQKTKIETIVKDRLDLPVNNNASTIGKDIVEFVEVIYQDANNNNQLQRLVIQVTN